MAKTAVLQTKQGIGDVIWHLPYVRAIAAATPEKFVSFFGLPSSCADQILEAEPCVKEVILFNHRGSEFQRARHLVELIGELRRHRIGTLWILDRSSRAAAAAFLARVPVRIGMGLGKQRFLITNRGLPGDCIGKHPLERLNALMESMSLPVATTEPNLQISPARRQRVMERYASNPRPWMVLAFGASPPNDWPESSWLQFVRLLEADAPGTIFLIGGPNYKQRSARIIADIASHRTVDACGLSLADATALIKTADLFVGPDSGPMNISAAVGTVTFGLFGSSPVLTYSAHIQAIRPDDGRPVAPDGMQYISANHVFERIMSHLHDRGRRLTET
jgi:heptosyltransferase-2